MSQVYDFSSYPTSDDISDGGTNQVGELLCYFLSGIMKPVKRKPTERKILTIVDSIIASACSGSFVSTVQMGIGFYLHKRFRSWNLIDLFHNLGISISYSEVCKYKASVTLETSNIASEGFVQFVFDNADQKALTVDGYDTFHVMGGVKCVTPASAVKTEITVPRPEVLPNATWLRKFGFIPTSLFDGTLNIALTNIEMVDVLSLQLCPPSAQLASIYNWIWMGVPWQRDPTWDGVASCKIAAGQQSYEKSVVIPLPFVNLDRTNSTTINTGLRFAAEEWEARAEVRSDVWPDSIHQSNGHSPTSRQNGCLVLCISSPRRIPSPNEFHGSGMQNHESQWSRRNMGRSLSAEHCCSYDK